MPVKKRMTEKQSAKNALEADPVPVETEEERKARLLKETAKAREILVGSENPKEETEAEQSATESADKPIPKRGRSPAEKDRQSPCRGARTTTRSTSQSRKIQKLREDSAQSHTIPPEQGEKVELEPIPKLKHFDADSESEQEEFQDLFPDMSDGESSVDSNEPHDHLLIRYSRDIHQKVKTPKPEWLISHADAHREEADILALVEKIYRDNRGDFRAEMFHSDILKELVRKRGNGESEITVRQLLRSDALRKQKWNRVLWKYRKRVAELHQAGYKFNYPAVETPVAYQESGLNKAADDLSRENGEVSDSENGGEEDGAVNQSLRESAQRATSSRQAITVTSGHVARALTQLSHGSLKTFRNELLMAAGSNNGASINLASLVNLELHTPLEIKLCGHLNDDKTPAEWLTLADRKAWQKWSIDTFFERVFKIWPTPNLVGSSVEAQIRAEQLTFTSANAWGGVESFLDRCERIYVAHGSPEGSLKEIIKEILRKFEKSGQAGRQASIELRRHPIPLSIMELWVRWEALRQTIDMALRYANQWSDASRAVDRNDTQPRGENANGAVRRPSRQERRQTEREAGKKPAKDKANKPANSHQQPLVSESCYGCGRRSHKTSDCKLLIGKHPDANTSSAAWAASDKGKAWLAAGFDYCQFERRIDGTAYSFTTAKPAEGAASPNKFDRRKGGRSEFDQLLYQRYDTLFVASVVSDITHTVPMKLLVPETLSPLNVNCLIDTGALQSNYISTRTAALLNATWNKESEKGVLDSSTCCACNKCDQGKELDLHSNLILEKTQTGKRPQKRVISGNGQQPLLVINRPRHLLVSAA